MKFLSLIIVLALVMLVASSPLPKKDNADDDSKDTKDTSKKDSKDDSKTASAAADGEGASVLKSQKYNDIQISDGVAGDAEEKAKALFEGIDRNNLAAVSKEDLDIIKKVHDVAEDAEVKAFNPALDSKGPDAKAIQVGKIKNKVLKLEATVLGLEIDQAKGKDVSAKLKEEQGKLAKNIATDTKSKGAPSKSVPFDG